ncbi:MAG: hypothetical protein K2L51_01555, partial [Clostridiales bacterium]|nr:hypothetical protein [Clostridiales bacterium]
TDTVTADTTLYAKWTPVQVVAGEIGWVKPAAGSVIIPSDYGKYNPAYRKTLEEFAPDVYATEDGEKIATIITDADELTYGEDGMLTAGDYTVTYTARDSMGDDHEETFAVKVVDAEESNYYVYVKTVGTAYADPKWEEILGKRIRVAADRYFESADGTLPEALINPHDPTLIVDFDDAYILKNASDNELTVRLSDKSGVYAVFDETGKVVYGVDGFQNKGISADWKYENNANGYTQKDTITLPAHSYMLAAGNSPLGNWYYVPDAPSWNPDETNLTAYRRDGRAFVFNSVATRYGNMVQLKRGSNVLTGAYVNQAPYMSSGYNAQEFVIGSAKPTKESLIAAASFRDDNGTFEDTDDVTVTTGIDVTAESYEALQMNAAGEYTIVFEVTDPLDNTLKAQYGKTIRIIVPTQYIKIGDSYLNAPTAKYNENYGKTAMGGDNAVYMWDSTYADGAETIPTAQYTVYVVIDKTTGKLIEAQNWSNLYNAENPNGTTITSANNLEGAKLRFATLAENELLIVFSQGATRDFGVKIIDAAKGANFANTYLEIRDLAGVNIPALEA